jgi:hypothetical protein
VQTIVFPSARDEGIAVHSRRIAIASDIDFRLFRFTKASPLLLRIILCRLFPLYCPSAYQAVLPVLSGLSAICWQLFQMFNSLSG